MTMLDQSEEVASWTKAYELLFKENGKLRAERDALLDKVRDYGGRMTDEQSSTLAELDEAIAATPNDLPSVGTEDARALAAMLIVHAGDHKDVAYECDMNPVHTLNWKHHVTSLDASKALLTLVSERDELASRVRELEGATTLLLRHFPTDTDLIEAGWSFTDTEVAMKAHETARAALASKEQP